MSEKNKSENEHLPDFLRYRQNKMTDRERNAFERRLQKDPFSEEASEGFEGIDPDLAEKDVSELSNSLKKRTGKKLRVIWYRIAASVAVLMILSTVFIITYKRKEPEQLAYSPGGQKKEEIQILKEEPVTENLEYAALPSEEKQKADIDQKRSSQLPARSADAAGKSEMKDENREVQIEIARLEAIRAAEAGKPDEVIGTEKGLRPKPEMARETRAVYSQIRGRIISSEDNEPIPGATIIIKGTDKGAITDAEGNFSIRSEDAVNRILVANFVGMEPKEFNAVEETSMEIRLDPSVYALSEVVVVGYGARDAADEAVNEYTPPLPANGRSAFDKYIRDNIRRPDTTTSGQRVVVVLNFNVNPDGKIDSIKVIRSPGKIFSDEAIRLIREGPAWKPAEENSKTINDEVRIRIVFK